MKIGLVTYTNTTDNYGQVLQCLACQEFLKQNGHEVYVLRLKDDKTKKEMLKEKVFSFVRFLFPFLRTEKGRIVSKWQRIAYKSEKKHPRFFELFRHDVFNIIEDSYNGLASLQFDAVASGSDQIWGSVSKWYMLGWTPDICIRFSLSSSVGHGTFSKEQILEARKYLVRYNYISVRERNGVELCNRCGVESSLLLDPTFLLTKEDYLQFAKSKVKSISKRYVFVYLVGANISLDVKEIFDFAKKYNLDVKYVESQGRNEHVKDKIYATIPEWINLINNSSYVVTNSFHGMAFSIIFRKQFLSIPISGVFSSMNLRITDLAIQTKLESHIFTGKLDALFDPIDWTTVEMAIKDNFRKINCLKNILR